LSRETIERFVTRIEVRKNQLALNLRSGENDIQGIQSNHDHPDPAEHRGFTSRIVVVPWKKPSRPAREILLPLIRQSIALGP
jgi:site-specific DNA recombinase